MLSFESYYVLERNILSLKLDQVQNSILHKGVIYILHRQFLGHFFIDCELIITGFTFFVDILRV